MSIVRIACLIVLLSTFGLSISQTKKKASPRPSPGAAQPDSLQGSPKIVTATKGVAQFWDTENELVRALEKKDQAALAKLLPEEFKVWMPNQTGSAVGREDWLASGRENPAPTQMVQMSVLFYPDLAIVKFLGKGKATGKGQAQQYFVVDVWELHDNQWGLTNRYLAAIPSVPLRRRR